MQWLSIKIIKATIIGRPAKKSACRSHSELGNATALKLLRTVLAWLVGQYYYSWKSVSYRQP